MFPLEKNVEALHNFFFIVGILFPCIPSKKCPPELGRPYPHFWASQVALVVKNPHAKAGDTGNVGSTPGSGRSPGEGHGSPLQYFWLEESMERGAWWATVHGVAKSQT